MIDSALDAQDPRGGQSDRNDGPVVATAFGRVRGLRRAGDTAFLGVPFAAPPVGELRFAPPAPPQPWEGVRPATAYGPTAHRAVPGEQHTTLIPEPTIPGDDTLTVNVFTPSADREARLPVLVWIHGGSYKEGCPASPWYDGAAFTRDGAVVVTVGYRLGFDGFGAIPGEPANRAVRDWIAALEWVQQNIEAFGGDPARVTVGGQSAGAGAVLTLLGVPRAEGLFRGAWASSAPLPVRHLDGAEQHARRLAERLGVAPTREGLAAVPVPDLLMQQEAAAQTGEHRSIPALIEGLPVFAPVVDGDLIPEPTLAALAAGAGSRVSLVLGSNDDEAQAAAGYAPAWLDAVPVSLALRVAGLTDGSQRHDYQRLVRDEGVHGARATVARSVTDRVFRRVVPEVAAARSGSLTFAYRFGWHSPAAGGAVHCLDVPFLWDVLAEPHVPALAGEAPPQPLADALHAAAVAHIRGDGPGWGAWEPGERLAAVFADPAGRVETMPGGYDDVAPLLG